MPHVDDDRIKRAEVVYNKTVDWIIQHKEPPEPENDEVIGLVAGLIASAAFLFTVTNHVETGNDDNLDEKWFSMVRDIWEDDFAKMKAWLIGHG